MTAMSGVESAQKLKIFRWKLAKKIENRVKKGSKVKNWVKIGLETENVNQRYAGGWHRSGNKGKKLLD